MHFLILLVCPYLYFWLAEKQTKEAGKEKLSELTKRYNNESNIYLVALLLPALMAVFCAIMVVTAHLKANGTTSSGPDINKLIAVTLILIAYSFAVLKRYYKFVRAFIRRDLLLDNELQEIPLTGIDSFNWRWLLPDSLHFLSQLIATRNLKPTLVDPTKKPHTAVCASSFSAGFAQLMDFEHNFVRYHVSSAYQGELSGTPFIGASVTGYTERLVRKEGKSKREHKKKTKHFLYFNNHYLPANVDIDSAKLSKNTLLSDYETTSIEFNKQFKVHAPDRSLAANLLSPAVISLLLSIKSPFRLRTSENFVVFELRSDFLSQQDFSYSHALNFDNILNDIEGHTDLEIIAGFQALLANMNEFFDNNYEKDK